MMKAVLLVFFLLATHPAMAISIGPFKGKMNNLTRFENNRFEIWTWFQCHKADVDFEYDRDTIFRKIMVNGDGTFEIPKLDLKHLTLPSYLGCRVELYYRLAPEQATSYGGYSVGHLELHGPQLYQNDIMTEFTAVETQPQIVDYKTASGTSSQDFVRGLGKNAIYRLDYDFSDIVPARLQKMAKQYFYRWGAPYKNSVGVPPYGILYVPGLHASKKIPVKVSAHVTLNGQDVAKVSDETELAWGLPRALLTIDVDDTKIKPMPFDGHWEGTIYMNAPLPSGKSATYYFNFETDLTCQNGALKGILQVRPYMDPDVMAPAAPIPGSYNVSGTCDGVEKAEPRFRMQYSDGTSKELGFSVARLADCGTADYCMMGADAAERFNFFSYPGADFGENMYIRDMNSHSIEGYLGVKRK